MAGLRSNLADLHSCLNTDNPSNNAQKAHDIAGDVGHVCLQDVTEKDIDYACSLLFSKDTGVVSFLRSAVKCDEYRSTKVELVEMLCTFTAKWPNKVMPYAVDIKDACVALYRRDKYANVKSSALILLIELLKHVSITKMAADLDVKKLVNHFFMDLSQPTKNAPSVKQLLYHILGVLAEGYPEEMVGYAAKLGDTYVRVIKAEMTSKTKKPDLQIISGCLHGLRHYLVNFTQSAEEDATHSFAIYKATKMAISRDVQLSRYDVPRAGLLLLAQHAPQFNAYIIDDYEVLYDTLKHWSSHHNREMLHLGTKALEAVLTQIAEMLVIRAKEGKREGGTFKFFIQKFRGIMDNPAASSKEVSLAIRGYGLFAAPCKMFLRAEDVLFMFNEMVQRSEQVFFDQAGVSDDRLLSLPSYLDALASIIHQLHQVSETFLWSLERLVVVLIENVPKINVKMHHACHLSLLRILHALMPKGAIFRLFLARVVYQSLIRTCSHPVVLVTQESALETITESDVRADDKPTVSYRSYITLWTSLLSSSRFKELLAEGVSVEERVALTYALYAELMVAILRVLGRLDLGSQRDEQQDAEGEPRRSDGGWAGSPETVTSDPVTGLQATKPKDFVIFINLVDFTRELLPNQLTHLFKCWVFKFGYELILYSTKYPLVSGFYKLLSVCMTICTKINYFKDIDTGSGVHLGIHIKKEEDFDEMEVDHGRESDTSECESCFLLFTKFTKEVLTRLKQYKDDLLASCLTFILSLPEQIVVTEISSIIPALQMSLRLGVSYLTLALLGLDTLERWTRTLPPHVINPYWSHVLPCLDPYLKTTRDTAAESGETVSLTSKGTSRKSGKKKLPIKLLAQTRADALKGQESQLAQVQHKCLTLLGTLGGSTNHHLVSSAGTNGGSPFSQQAVAWDSVNHLRFDMPFMDIKPVIYFDPFLPRVAELAMTSGDRQTKVAACELLHTLVLYTIGRGVQKRAGHVRRDSMEKLYRKLFPIIMTLACDVEQVAKQLFEPLMMQLIHWFTGNRKYESEDTMALLDTLIDGIVDPTDTARRDFSAKCLHEFLVWSIKQATKKEIEKSPGNIKSLMKRLYSLAHHPSAFKRLGSALAFNSIYSVFREEDSLVDRFTFQILVNYMESLALAHNDDKSLGTQEQCRQVLNHIERIIKAKATLLVKVNKQRIVPREWTDATLLTAVRWLVRQCGRPHAECRHAAMHLVVSLAPCIDPQIKSARDFFTHMQKESGPNYFIVRFECGKYRQQCQSGLAQCHTMARLADAFTLNVAVHWYDMLLATLDCYTWVFGQNLLSPAKSLVVSGNKGTVLFKVMAHFLNDLALEDISAAAGLFKVKQNVLLFTPHERNEYNRVKCTAIVRLLDFVVILIGVHQKDSLKVVPGSFWSDNLWELVATCVLQPTKVGFNMADVDVMMKLPEQMARVLQVINRLQPEVSKGFATCLTQKLAKGKECDLDCMLPLSLVGSGENQRNILHTVQGLSQLNTMRLLQPAISHVGDQRQVATRVLQSVFNGVVEEVDVHKSVLQLTPHSVDLAVALLQLAFNIGVKPKDILDMLLDTTPLRQPGAGTARHGAVFYTQFTLTLNRHFLHTSALFVPALCYHGEAEWVVVGAVLTGMLETASRDRALRQTEGKDLVRLLMEQWRHLAVWWETKTATQETKAQALYVLTKMLVVDSKLVCDQESDNFAAIFSMYLDYLTDRHTSLAFKCRVLDLLAFFVNFPEPLLKKLKDCLNRFVADNFPMQSSEFTVGSPKHSDYISALNKILSALDISGSLMLLELVLSIVCRETPHVHEDEIQNTLVHFVRRLPAGRQRPALDVPYAVFIRDGTYPDHIRRAALQRACLPMLRAAHQAALTEFFSSHIKEIMATLEAKFNKGVEDIFSTELVSKTCCFELLEVMYSRLPKEAVFTKTSQINAVFCDQRAETGKELTMTITKMSNQAKSEDCRGEEVCRDLRREYHCAAYNTLIATISCTQTDVKFYNGFLFNENLAKGQFLFDNIVDSEKSYSFLIEMEALHERKKRFVSIRNEVRTGHLAENENQDETSSVHYLASQYLADSSLSTDVSQFDFGSSAATVSLSGSAGGERRIRLKKKDSGFEEPTVTIEADYVEMEMDELNQHECMATLTALLQHMKRNNITPPLEKGVSPAAMPVWMDNLHKKMRHHSTSTNVKLFLAKLLINTEEVFQPYARFWIQPLIQLVVTGETRCPGIHYFIVDIVVTVLSWHTVAIPEDTATDRLIASSLLEFLLKNCQSNNRRIFRNNLEVIKTLVEVWKARLDIPHRVIFDNFSQSEKGTANAAGIQMLGVVLANKLPPYSTSSGVSKDKFFQRLAVNMTSPLKAVHAPAAEVVGMALQQLTGRGGADPEAAWRHEYVANIARMLQPVQATRPGAFVTCVYRMQLHHPPVTDRFISKILFLLPRLHGDFRVQCLEMITNRGDHIDNVFTEMKTHFISLLTHRDEGCQLASLKLVQTILAKLKAEELLMVLPPVVAFSKHPSAACRATMYDILMWIYDNYREEDTDSAHSIMSATKDGLLTGLSDEHLKNRLTVQNFWSHETRLPTGTVDRLAAMLQAMYAPSTERQYLAYATNLVLEMTSKSPDYNRAVFEHPLSECRFEDYTITSSWRQRHAAMTPLFVATQMSQMQGSGDIAMETDDVRGHVRATQDAAGFTPTLQEGSAKAPYNWLTQNSLDTYSDYSLAQPPSEETQSSLLFTVARTQRGPAKRTVPGADFGKGRMARIKEAAGVSEVDPGERSDILRLKKRFLKDQGTSAQLYFMKKNARLKQLRAEVRKEQKIRRENTVTLYRKYRAGDLPDIQVKFSYIIAPLQALAQRDSHIGRLLFGSLFKSIFPEIEAVKTDREARETVDQITRSLNDMLANSTQYYPSFIACVLDIALEFPRRLRLEPGMVNTACVIGQQQPLGIILLEEMLLYGVNEEEARPVKRARVSGHTPVSHDTTTWIELARLYKSLGDYDVLRGIFSSRVGTQELTMKAMEAEMRGDYTEAMSLYNQGLARTDWEDSSPSEAEVDLWDTCRLECCHHLADWGRLEVFTTQAVDDANPPNLDLVWDDTYFQEHYLPFILRGRLKLLAEGGDQQALLKFVDDALGIPERKALLESSYCEELALLYTWQEDYDRARHFSTAAQQAFLQEWGGLNTLMESSRSLTLQRLQKLTELQEFLTFMGNESNFQSVAPATLLVNRWLHRSPDPILDSTKIWDDIVTNRSIFLDHISCRLETAGVKDDPDDFTGGLWGHPKVKMWLGQAESACLQDNFPVASKQIKRTHKVLKTIKDDRLLLEWAATYAAYNVRRAQIASLKRPGERLSVAMTAFDQLEKFKDNKALMQNPTLGTRHFRLKGLAVREVTSLVQDAVTLDDFDPDLQKKVKVMAGNGGDSDIDQVVLGLVEQGFGHLKMAISIADQGTDAVRATGDVICTSRDLTGMTDAHMAFVRYCDHYLQQAEQDEKSNVKCGSFDKFHVAMVTSVLTAMQLGSEEARQRFPRLLQILERFPDTIDIFIRKAAQVPCWMFLGWLAQLTAILDKPESPAVHQLLLNMANTYPDALVYPFKLSDDGYNFCNTSVGKKSKSVRDQLDAILSKNKLINAFISALEQFGQPSAIFKDWCDDVQRMLSQRSNQQNADKIISEFQKMYKDLMDLNASEKELYNEDDSTASSQIPERVGMGRYRCQFAKKHSAAVAKICGTDGKKLLTVNSKSFQREMKALKDQMGSEATIPCTLKEYSSWLANFQAASHGQDLPLPGQYTGRAKPMPEYHVKINSFDDRVLVMSSIRKPKRIAIRGNDELEYLYLVKGGEDLRQDQRVEELFSIMNDVFLQDATCRRRKYAVRTYQVIPMTTRVGMIEWMKKTIPLKDFLEDAMTDGEMNFYRSQKGPANDYKKFLGGCDIEDYFRCYEKHSRSDVVTALRRREESVPWDLLRRAYRKLSCSSEAYFTLRSNFGTTHALISVCQYLLGIGDRHLSNFMIDLVTGCMVGIDFGHAFGSATTFLPIPELMPLRMTRQLRNLLLPLREKGLVEGTMLHALRALRNNSELLLATMDVFVKEPSLDWQQNAEKQRKIQGIKYDADLDTNWYPKQKVMFAKRKLQGHHPTYITRDELALGHKKKAVYRHMEKVLLGDHEHDIRARLPNRRLTIEQQVACLLNQATDPNILGRVWQGWASWL